MSNIPVSIIRPPFDCPHAERVIRSSLHRTLPTTYSTLHRKKSEDFFAGRMATEPGPVLSLLTAWVNSDAESIIGEREAYHIRFTLSQTHSPQPTAQMAGKIILAVNGIADTICTSDSGIVPGFSSAKCAVI
jgi:hypothetical protein